MFLSIDASIRARFPVANGKCVDLLGRDAVIGSRTIHSRHRSLDNQTDETAAAVVLVGIVGNRHLVGPNRRAVRLKERVFRNDLGLRVQDGVRRVPMQDFDEENRC